MADGPKPLLVEMIQVKAFASHDSFADGSGRHANEEEDQAPLVNDEGATVTLGSARHAGVPGGDGTGVFYCGRHLGTAVIPGSDGVCGPDGGPQCPSCRRLQHQQRSQEIRLKQHCGWALVFEDVKQELIYLEEANSRNYNLVWKVWLVGSLLCGLEAALKMAQLSLDQGRPRRLAPAMVRVFVFILLQLWAVLSWTRSLYVDSGALVTSSLCASAVICSLLVTKDDCDRHRTHEEHNFLCEAEKKNDILVVLAWFLMMNCFAHMVFEARSRWIWLLPMSQVVGTCVLFSYSPGGFHTHNFGPHPAFIVACFAGTCWFQWHGRYCIELRERLSWAERRSLSLEISGQRAALALQAVRLKDLEHTLVTMRTLENGVKEPRAAEQTASPTNHHRSKQVPVPRPPHIHHIKDPSAAPNALLVSVMAGKTTELARIQRMARRISQPSYGLQEFLSDCVEAFPELELFFAQAPEAPVSFVPSPGGSVLVSSSGRSAAEEYQRTIGALFAVYWLLRMDVSTADGGDVARRYTGTGDGDGRRGFCYGVDDEWRTRPAPLPEHAQAPDAAQSAERRRRWRRQRREEPAPTAEAASVDLPFVQMTSEERRRAFYQRMDWNKFSEIITLAGCQAEDRIVALLSLTSFHDVMKMRDLCPTVQAEHAPYFGYAAGTIIDDHDVALSYVLEHYGHLLPSFACLPEDAQRAVRFTQGKMQFNHGWFVQAEAPPGAMLATFKQVLKNASSGDFAFYFLHWLTDLAGAEGTPMAGAEKLVIKFPHAVLGDFLWSIPFLNHLQAQTETAVAEAYLEARWKATFQGKSLPSGPSRVAQLRLAVMAQGNAVETVAAFRSFLSREDQALLSVELARTGVEGQSYQSSPVTGGPALLVYYGPALLQRAQGSFQVELALNALAAVYRAGRALFPISEDRQGETVTLEVAQLKVRESQDIFENPPGEPRAMWVLVQRTDRSAVCELWSAAELNRIAEEPLRYVVLELRALPRVRRGAGGSVQLSTPMAASRTSGRVEPRQSQMQHA